MAKDIELITLSPSGSVVRPWALGRSAAVPPSPRAVSGAIAESSADAILCLDAGIALPDPSLLTRLLAGPADVWHGGGALGLLGEPRLWDYVDPLSMFSATVDPRAETTSWRVSLRAALVRRTVIDQLGGPDPSVETLTGAGLEAGLRWIRAGALVRHVPRLVASPSPPRPDAPPSLRDSFRAVRRHRGRAWAMWSLQRSVVRGEVGLGQLPAVVNEVLASPPDLVADYVAPPRPAGGTDRPVTVVLPTVDRYDYLVPLLGQLADQTVRPCQVVIVDQTPASRRRRDLADVAPGLPVEVVGLAPPGQSTARNAALQRATGQMALFIDDDDDIPPTLIEDHLHRLVDGVDASCGGVEDATAGPPPAGFLHRRASDVFPTNNSMVRVAALERSGLFDPAFDRGPRADHDLGTRLHASGAMIVYDPAVRVFHHHAQTGGLRTHGARRVTRASARRSLVERDVPSSTQLLLGHRYFTGRQRREGHLITLMSIVSGEGPGHRRLARAAIQVVLLPDTIRRLAAAERIARGQAEGHAGVPALSRSIDTTSLS